MKRKGLSPIVLLVGGIGLSYLLLTRPKVGPLFKVGDRVKNLSTGLVGVIVAIQGQDPSGIWWYTVDGGSAAEVILELA